MELLITLRLWKGINATCHLIATFATIFRIQQRIYNRRMWWDDYWAGLGLLFSCGYFATVWMRKEPGDPTLGQTKGVVLFWMTTLFFPCEVWSARMSLAFAITRLVPERAIFRRRCMYIVVVIFGLMWLVLLLQKLWVCAGDTAWEHNEAVQCYLGSPIGIITLCTDLSSDILLIVIPCLMLREVRLPSKQRRLLRATFCSSIFSSIAGVVYAAFVFHSNDLGPQRGLLISLTANVKAAVTLLVCDMLVLVTYFYRTFRRDEDPETDDALPEPRKDVPTPEPLPSDPIYTTTELSSFPTIKTTSTFDPTPCPRRDLTRTSSRFVNTAGTTLPTITEAGTRTASVLIHSLPNATKSAPL